MQVKAKLSRLRIAPRKVRLVVDTIRGLDVEVAQNNLQFMNKKSARPMLKLLNSAIANAQNNFKLKKNNLYISELRVDGGSTLKRWVPRAMGRASAINKRTSHINIVLNERVETKLETKELRNEKIEKQEDEKDKDVKVVQSLDEIKELEKKEEAKQEEKKLKDQDVVKDIKDTHREGSDRAKQHLDKLRKKGKGGFLKKVFRRKSI